MAQEYARTREVPRHRLPDGLTATIELDADDAIRLVVPLLQLSAGGVGFILPGETQGVFPAAMLAGAVIRFGELEIHGNAQVLYTNALSDGRYYCGARFFPASEEDANELIGLATRLGDLPRN